MAIKLPEFTLVVLNSFVDVDKVMKFVNSSFMDIGYEIEYSIEYDDVPEEAYNESRDQYEANKIINYLKEKYNGFKVIGLTDLDIYIDLYAVNYIFGVAEEYGKYALVSCFRLISDDYDSPMSIIRSAKEVNHEIGHLFGLDHCSNEKCVMSFSSSVVEIDEKDVDFCDECKERLKQNIKHVLDNKI